MAIEAAPLRELGFRAEEVVQEGFVNLHLGGSFGEVRETRGLARSDELLRRPDVVGCGPSQEIGPMEILGPVNCLEVSLPGESGEAHEVFRAVLFSKPAGFGVFLRRAVREGVHQGFDLGEGRAVGVWRRMVAVRQSRE